MRRNRISQFNFKPGVKKMASINSNIGALQAQKSMTDQIAKSDQAIERLSTGLRINNAPDEHLDQLLHLKWKLK